MNENIEDSKNSAVMIITMTVLPPISLVAFSFFLVGYLINLFGRK